MILKEFDLVQFDESEADNMFDGLLMQRWGYHSPAEYVGPLSGIDLTVSRPWCDVL